MTSNAPDSNAKNAIDGSSVCTFNYEYPLKNTLSSTNIETNPWWQAELEKSILIKGVVIKGRKDGV